MGPACRRLRPQGLPAQRPRWGRVTCRSTWLARLLEVSSRWSLLLPVVVSHVVLRAVPAPCPGLSDSCARGVFWHSTQMPSCCCHLGQSQHRAAPRCVPQSFWQSMRRGARTRRMCCWQQSGAASACALVAQLPAMPFQMRPSLPAPTAVAAQRTAPPAAAAAAAPELAATAAAAAAAAPWRLRRGRSCERRECCRGRGGHCPSRVRGTDAQAAALNEQRLEQRLPCRLPACVRRVVHTLRVNKRLLLLVNKTLVGKESTWQA